MDVSSNYETNSFNQLLLANTQVSRLTKAFGNGSSANIKFSKTQLFKIIKFGEFVDELIASLRKAVFKPGLEWVTELAKDKVKVVRENAPLLVENATVSYVNKKSKELSNKVKNELS